MKKTISIILISVVLFFSLCYSVIGSYYKNIQDRQEQIINNYNKNEEEKIQAKQAEYECQKQDAQQRYEAYIQKFIEYYGYTPEESEYPVKEDGFNYYVTEIPESITGIESDTYDSAYCSLENKFEFIDNPYYSIEISVNYWFYEDKEDDFRKNMYANVVWYFLKPIHPDITKEETIELINSSIDLIGENDSPMNNLTGMFTSRNNVRFMFYLHGFEQL